MSVDSAVMKKNYRRDAGYTNQQFYNALDPDIRSLPDFRVRLLTENGNNQAIGVNSIFNFYGY